MQMLCLCVVMWVLLFLSDLWWKTNERWKSIHFVWAKHASIDWERESNRKIEKGKDNHRTIHVIDENSRNVCLRKTNSTLKPKSWLLSPHYTHTSLIIRPKWCKDENCYENLHIRFEYIDCDELGELNLLKKIKIKNPIEDRVHLIQRYWLHEIYTLRKARSKENVVEEFEEKKNTHTYTNMKFNIL